MNKKDKEELKIRIINDDIDKKDKRFILNIGLIKPCIYLLFFLLALFSSLANDSHLIQFAHIMFNKSSLSDMLYVIYYLILSIGLLFALISLGIGIYNFVKKDNKWLYKVGLIYDLYSFLINTIIIIFYILVFIFTPCVVSGPSMSSTLDNGDRLLLFDCKTNYNDGDIVVFSGNKYVNDDIMVIKRVVAKEGDSLSYDYSTASFYVNNSFVEKISLSSYNEITSAATITVVPHNKLVVFGDNRDNSLDSRYFGMIDTNDIYGKAILRLFPLNKFCILN